MFSCDKVRYYRSPGFLINLRSIEIGFISEFQGFVIHFIYYLGYLNIKDVFRQSIYMQ